TGSGPGSVRRPMEPAHRQPRPGDRQHRGPGEAVLELGCHVHDLARARLLTVRGYGHTEFTNPSTCAADYEVRYLTTGALPPAGTVCQQDGTPFGISGRMNSWQVLAVQPRS